VRIQWRRTAARATLISVLLSLLGLEGGPVVAEPGIPWRPRPLPAASIETLDPFMPMPTGARPRSDLPVAGVAFVSCTRLWVVLPDGSARRQVVERAGLSSPAFSPDARTIAFIADEREIWMAAADGSAVRRVGELRRFGSSVAPTARGLAWSPDGERLGFALVTPQDDPWAGGSVIWTLDLSSGSFQRGGSGWPVPFWAGRRLAAGSWVSEEGADFPDWRSTSRLSTQAGDLTAALAGRGAATLHGREGGDVRLVFRRRSWSRRGEAIEPPPGFRIPEVARVGMTEEQDLVAVDLVDGSGTRSIGMVGPDTRIWRVLGDAWEPAVSPAPSVIGPVDAHRAVTAAAAVLRGGRTENPRDVGSLMAGRRTMALPFRRRPSVVTGRPRERAGAWVVPAVAHGRTPEGLGYVDVEVRVREIRGRLVAEPVELSRVRPLANVDQVLAFLEHAVGVDTRPITWLPEGADLARRWPITTWKYRHGGFGSVRFALAGPEGAYLRVAFGNVSFQMGCGSPEEIRPAEVGGEPARLGTLDQQHQVIWPAVAGDDEATARFSVDGGVSEETVLAVAEAMASG